MALDNGTIDIFSATLEDILYQTNPTLGLTRDRSSEVTGSGDNLQVDSLKTTITIANTSKLGETAQATQLLDDTRTALVLNKDRAFKVGVDDVDMQSRPYDVISSAAMQTAEAMRDEIEDNAVAELGSVTNNTSVLTAKHSGTTDNAKWGSTEFRTELVGALLDKYVAVRRLNWPEMGLYALMAPEVKAQLVGYLIDKGAFGSGTSVDQAWASAAIGDVIGFTPVTTNAIAGNAAAAGTNQFPVFFGIRGNSLNFAQQVGMTETFRSQDYFADIIRGRNRYGFKVIDGDKTAKLTFTLTA